MPKKMTQTALKKQLLSMSMDDLVYLATNARFFLLGPR